MIVARYHWLSKRSLLHIQTPSRYRPKRAESGYLEASAINHANHNREKRKEGRVEVELRLAGLSVYRSVGEDSAVWRYNLNWVRCPLRESKAGSRKNH